MEISDLILSNAMTSSTSAAKTSEENSEVSISDFFQLMAAELQNQSMYDSVDSSEYMNQLVQYTMLSQLQEMSSLTNTSYAVSLVGKEVSLVVAETYISGTVEGVVFSGDTPYISVGGENYELSDILTVS